MLPAAALRAILADALAAGVGEIVDRHLLLNFRLSELCLFEIACIFIVNNIAKLGAFHRFSSPHDLGYLQV